MSAIKSAAAPETKSTPQPIAGKFSNAVTVDCPLGGIYCTTQEVTGSLTGTDSFVETAAFEKDKLWLGTDTITTNDGMLILDSSGAFDPETNATAGLMRVTGGTGKFDGATGTLFLTGYGPDQQQQRGEYEYHGEIRLK